MGMEGMMTHHCATGCGLELLRYRARFGPAFGDVAAWGDVDGFFVVECTTDAKAVHGVGATEK